MLNAVIAAVAIVASPVHGAPQRASPPVRLMRSATLSRDVNGFALGMSLADIRKRMPVEHVAGETFTGALDGVNYEFGVTPLGRVYRIESKQLLGRFNPDRQFTLALSAKLQRKYGLAQTNQLPGGPMMWNLIENVTHSNGQVLPFNTMTAYASLDQEQGGTGLDIWMEDYRVLWADTARLNSKPRDEAANQVHF